MEDESAIDPNACPRCGTPVEGEKISGIWSGRHTTADGRVFWGGPVYSAVCKECLIDLESWIIKEYADARKFDWIMRELGPPRPPRRTYRDEKKQRDSALGPLLQARADRAQVIASLGLEFTDFSAGSSQRAELKKWLFFDEVNDAASRHPGIFFHLGDLTMTWLFFDSEDRLQGCFIRPT